MWFRHPKPFIQKAVAMQMVKRAAAPAADVNNITIDKVQPVATAPAPLVFSVNYTLRDYQVSASKGPLWASLTGMPGHVIRRYRTPACVFRIDSQGVTQTSTAGTLNAPWEELREVRALRASYLLIFTRGEIPIPYRSLSAQQRAQLRHILARRHPDWKTS